MNKKRGFVLFGGLRKKIFGLFKKEEEMIEQKLEQKTEEPATEEEISAPQEEKKEQFKAEEQERHPSPEKDKEEPKKQESQQETQAKEEPKKRSFLPKLTLGTKVKRAIIRKAVVSEKDVESLLWDFQLELLEADVSVSVADRICAEIKENLVGKEISSRQSIQELTHDAIKKAISEVVIEPDFDFIEKTKARKPFVIMFVGPNGHGKSTTIGKLSYYLRQKGVSSVLVAADTFRAAAIEQLEKIGAKAGARVVKQQYGADPAAVAFDGVKHAEAKGIDVVLIDTAGRSELNTNLMEQMKKIVRVAKPDMKVYIGEALAGNAAVEEAKKFNEFIDLDGVIMTKTDCDVKGGSILSISYEIKKPILFIGLGQGIGDLQ
ncbi:MAG: signal recognition particle-docking protein FtsY, partial [archaeon]